MFRMWRGGMDIEGWLGNGLINTPAGHDISPTPRQQSLERAVCNAVADMVWQVSTILDMAVGIVVTHYSTYPGDDAAVRGYLRGGLRMSNQDS